MNREHYGHMRGSRVLVLEVNWVSNELLDLGFLIGLGFYDFTWNDEFLYFYHMELGFSSYPIILGLITSIRKLKLLVI